jgi:hypothetical protein
MPFKKGKPHPSSRALETWIKHVKKRAAYLRKALGDGGDGCQMISRRGAQWI